MKPFAGFCAHYQLDPNTEETREQYRDYCDKLSLFRQAEESKFNLPRK